MGFGSGGGGSSSISGASDAALNNPQNSQVLTYDTVSAKWKNASIPVSSTQPEINSKLGIFKAAVANRNNMSVPLVFAGSSTIAGAGASAADRQFVRIFTALVQAAYPLRSGTHPSFVSLGSATLPLANGIQGIGAGISGSTSSNFLTSTTIGQIAALAPRCIIIQVGANDYGSNVNPATYKANMTSQLANLRSAINAPCLYVLVHQYRRGDTTPNYSWSAYANALNEIADASSDAMFINTEPYFTAAGSPSPDPFDLLGSDNLHSTDAGHAMIADVLKDSFKLV